jgi:hypothetical protein
VLIAEDRGRAIVKERADGRCEAAIDYVCYGSHDTTHHRLKKGQGGSWAPSNLLGVCGDGTVGCHGYIEANPSWAMEEGLWVRSTSNPRDVSVHMRWANQKSWWFLDDEGLLHWDESDFEDLALNRTVTSMMSFTPKSQR